MRRSIRSRACVSRAVLASLTAAGILASVPAWAQDARQPGLKLRGYGPSQAWPGTSLVDVSITLPRAGWLPSWVRQWSDVGADDLSLFPRRLADMDPAARPVGLRASGGVVGVSRHTVFGATVQGDFGPVDLSLAGPRLAFAHGLTVSVPYVGIGYSSSLGTAAGGALRSSQARRWDFTADLGIMALTPRSAVRLDRAQAGQQTLDDALRDVRLMPLLQLGVTYSF